MKEENKDQKPKSLLLWHGTSGTDPVEVILKGNGLTTAYASDSGLWGRGIYFAVNANYSCPSYSYRVPGRTNVFQVFLCEVLVGNWYESGSKTNS